MLEKNSIEKIGLGILGICTCYLLFSIEQSNAVFYHSYFQQITHYIFFLISLTIATIVHRKIENKPYFNKSYYHSQLLPIIFLSISFISIALFDKLALNLSLSNSRLTLIFPISICSYLYIWLLNPTTFKRKKTYIYVSLIFYILPIILILLTTYTLRNTYLSEPILLFKTENLNISFSQKNIKNNIYKKNNSVQIVNVSKNTLIIHSYLPTLHIACWTSNNLLKNKNNKWEKLFAKGTGMAMRQEPDFLIMKEKAHNYLYFNKTYEAKNENRLRQSGGNFYYPVKSFNRIPINKGNYHLKSLNQNVYMLIWADLNNNNELEPNEIDKITIAPK